MGNALPFATKASSEHSGPVMHSSMRTVLPASPNLPSKHSRTASSASSTVEATTTPLPAARPSAFTTMGAPCSRMKAIAGSHESKVAYAAVGMSFFSMNALLCALLPSSSAPAASGPKTEMPASRNSSATPATSGASGPMTTRSTPCSRTKESTDEPLIISTSLTLVATAAVPPLPGATNSSSHRGDLESAHAIACSRPPLPSTKMFTTNPFSQVRQIQARKAREPSRKAAG